jgi:nucleotide-binding universal stress UspA family protein
MIYKKLFYPVAGGNELQERLYGALRIAKYFKVHMEIMKSTPSANIYNNIVMPSAIMHDIENIIDDNFKQENEEFQSIVEKAAKDLEVSISPFPIEGQGSVEVMYKRGDRSSMAAQESKFCDFVTIASPPNGIATATFEAVVLSSGKPVLMFPRKMSSFSTESIIIGWNNSQEASRATSAAIPLLKQAKRVHIVTAKQYASDLSKLDRLRDFLSKFHGIQTSVEMVVPKIFAGEALFEAAKKGNFDLIVAGAYGHNGGLKELMLGGATKYLLTHTDLPVFMSH